MSHFKDIDPYHRAIIEDYTKQIEEMKRELENIKICTSGDLRHVNILVQEISIKQRNLDFYIEYMIKKTA